MPPSAGSVIQGWFPHGMPRFGGAAPAGGTNATKVPPHLAHFHGAGQPLSSDVRQKMEALFQARFAEVRVHVGPHVSALGARAFTHGHDVHFAPGEFDPASLQGQQVLAHELAHVVQQRNGRARNPFGSGVAIVHDAALEAEAHRMVQRLAVQPAAPVPPRVAVHAPLPHTPAVQLKAAHATHVPAPAPRIPAPVRAASPAAVLQGKFRGGVQTVVQCCRRAGVAAPQHGPALQLPPSFVQLSPTGGSPMPRMLRQSMEQLFGASFDDVRVHVGREAGALGASALTQGSHVYFAAGEYAPHTAAGRRLLAHELTHVVQQRTARVRNPFGSGLALVQDRSLDAEAERMSTRASAAYALQMKKMSVVLNEQATILNQLKNKDDEALGNYTTVGFEFDLAEMAPDTELQGIAHLEIAKSQQTQLGLPYLLETDAANVLEFVTPPFFVRTVKKGEPVPAMEGVREIIDAMHGEFKKLTDIDTVRGLATSSFGDLGLNWEMEEGKLGIQPRNWSWRTSDNIDYENLTAADIMDIPLKVNPTVAPQVNIATSGTAYAEVFSEKGSRAPDNLAVETLHDLTGVMMRAATAWQTTNSQQAAFKEQFLRVLAQQTVVPCLKQLLDIQKKGLKEGPQFITGDKKMKKIAEDVANMASFVKDTGNVWLKDDVMSFGLGMLTRNDWKAVKAGLEAIGEDEGKFAKTVTHTLGKQAETIWPLIYGVIMNSHKSVKDEILWEMDYGNRDAPLHDWLLVDPNKWPKLHEHRTDIPGVRQDTFIKATAMRNVSELLGFDKRLHVLEVRNPDTLNKIFTTWKSKHQ